jgi:hypothetical protein
MTLLAASPLVQTSALLSPLLSVTLDHPSRFAAVLAKCRVGLTPQLLEQLVDDDVIVNSPEVVSLVLAALLSGPKETSSSAAAAVVVQLCIAVLVNLPVSAKFEDLNDIQNDVSSAKVSGTVSARLVFDNLEQLGLDAAGSQHMVQIQQLLAMLPQLYEAGKSSLAATCLDYIQRIAGSGTALLSLLLLTSSRAAADNKTRLFCLLKAAEQAVLWNRKRKFSTSGTGTVTC